MYPERIGRLVIDGVYDAHDYRSMQWSTNLEFIDDVFASFHRYCYQAGPEKCPLYSPSIDEIQHRVEAILASLDEDPVPIPFSPKGPNVLTRKFVHNLIFRSTYSPIALFPGVARVLLAAEQRNISALANIPEISATTPECNCEAPLPRDINSALASAAIACGDGVTPPEGSPNFIEYFSRLTKKSPLFAPIWAAMINIKCSEWNIAAKWRYAGSFGAANTSHPILVVSPTFDNVCPITDGRAVRKRYAGAGLLVQNSYGHCSVAGPSLCTAKHLRAYFLEGTLPEDGVVCEVNELPFVGEVGTVEPEDRELFEALKHLTSAW